MVTQLMAVAIAAFFLGIGLAGEPLAPLPAIIAGAVLVVAALLLGSRASPLATFLMGFVGVLLTCYLQHHDYYLFGSGVVALGLGALAASSYGRRMAPALIVGLGAVLGAGLFFVGVPAGY
ncbi:MAG: hypothetical protein JOZ01_07730 [Candidatus Eremiobacteraeota bacterium]|nr:hypothetical protein [Candidatus Eremiobacteraeota bacterium]